MSWKWLIISNGGGNSNLLNITVLTDKIESKGLVTGGYLDNGASIGVTVTSTSGGNYDNIAYNNIQFTSSGTGTSQKWSGGTVNLSAADGYCYAYYPYSPSTSSITAIPVTAGGTDYMYATPVTVNDKDKDATLNMKHALAAIRFALKKGTYTGTGAVSSVSVASSALGASGKLNAKTGGVIAANLGTAVSQSAGFNLETTAKNVDVVMVPSGNAGAITLSVTIDGKVYSTEVTSTTIKQGSCYTCTLTVNAGNLSLSGIEIDDWGYDDLGSPVITAGGYKITFAGDYEDIGFINSVNSNSVIIKAISIGDEQPRKVSISGLTTLSQSVDALTKIRTITLSNISSDVTVTFNGLGSSSWDLVTEDGVYYIDDDGDYEATASSSCIGVALINSAKNQRLMIEKYENANNDESTTIYTTAAQQLNGPYTCYFSWGGYGTDRSGITNYYNVDGSVPFGYLYFDGRGLNIDPSTWSSGALSDFSGKSNSELIKKFTTNGTSSKTYAPMAFLMNAFNAEDCPASVCQGYHDWYVPSCGQLGLIYLNLTAINNALTAIGGTTFTADSYWSSSEYNSKSSWHVFLDNGHVTYNYDKASAYRVRLVRDF